jgi:hypothetical protein
MNRPQHRIEITADFMSGDSEESDAIFSHPTVSLTVAGGAPLMHASIDLYNQPCRWTEEVRDIPSHRMLTAELQTRQAPGSQLRPEHNFRDGLLLSQLSGTLSRQTVLHAKKYATNPKEPLVVVPSREKVAAGLFACTGRRSVPPQDSSGCAADPSPRPSPARGEGGRSLFLILPHPPKLAILAA